MTKKIDKFPAHWPFAPPEQQYEGFKSFVENSNITVWEFERRMRVLVRVKFMGKARMHKLIKWFRHIKGISYQEYQSKRDRSRLTNQIPQGLWI